MYDEFEKLVQGGTWHTGKPSDEKRFNLALARVVDRADFSPDVMGERMLTAIEARSGLRANYAYIVRDLVSRAWAVRDFLQATGR